MSEKIRLDMTGTHENLDNWTMEELYNARKNIGDKIDKLLHDLISIQNAIERREDNE